MTSLFPRRWLIAAGLALLAGSASVAAPAMPEEMSLGNAKAKVTVVEYASLSCPHCARFNNDVFPAFKKKYVDTGKVRYVLREFLTPPAEVAGAAFLVARCAGPSKYFTAVDHFFRGQEEMYRSGDAKAAIMSQGAAVGLSEAQVEACLTDEAATKALNERVRKYVEDHGVHGTPTFLVNGKPLPDSDHEVTLADLDAALAPLLNARGP